MSIYHYDDLDDFVTQRQSDEACPWGDPDDIDVDVDQLWAEDVIEELLNDIFDNDII